MSYKRQELRTLRGHLASPAVSGGVCVANLLLYSVFCVLFVYVLCLVRLMDTASSGTLFSVGHCVVSSSSIYGF